jgi:hypothetical protein
MARQYSDIPQIDDHERHRYLEWSGDRLLLAYVLAVCNLELARIQLQLDIEAESDRSNESTPVTELWPEEVIELLLHIDRNDMLRRLREDDEEIQTLLEVAEYNVVDPWGAFPIVSLTELEAEITTFKSALKADKEHLVKVGWPGHELRKSVWLDCMLERLYNVKCPSMIYHFRDQNVIAYSWAPVGIPSRFRGASEYWGPQKDTHGDDASYEDASYMDGVTSDDAIRLEAGRERFFELKVAILEELLCAVQARSPEGLWERCLYVLTGILTAEEADFYLRMDRLYTGFDIRTGDVADDEEQHRPGGLTDLLTVIGHVEKELTFRTMDRVRKRIGKPLNLFELMDRGNLTIFNAAVDLFLDLARQEGVFWIAYCERVNEALESEFFTEVVTRMKVRRKLAHKYEPAVQKYAEFVCAHLELSGEVPDLEAGTLLRLSTKDRNVFRRVGDTWSITYVGITFHMSDIMGLHYVSCLLQHPHGEIHALELDSAVRGLVVDAELSLLNRAQTTDFAVYNGRNVTGGPALDVRATREIEQHLQDVKAEIEEAKELGNEARSLKLQQAYDLGTKYLNQGRGLHGGDRTTGSDSERARVNVTSHIRRCLRRIREHNEPLYSHLDAFIRTGAVCSYAPDQAIAWTVDRFGQRE